MGYRPRSSFLPKGVLAACGLDFKIVEILPFSPILSEFLSGLFDFRVAAAIELEVMLL